MLKPLLLGDTRLFVDGRRATERPRVTLRSRMDLSLRQTSRHYS